MTWHGTCKQCLQGHVALHCIPVPHPSCCAGLLQTTEACDHSHTQCCPQLQAQGVVTQHRAQTHPIPTGYTHHVPGGGSTSCSYKHTHHTGRHRLANAHIHAHTHVHLRTCTPPHSGVRTLSTRPPSSLLLALLLDSATCHKTPSHKYTQ